MGLPFFVNCSFLIQRVIYFETAPMNSFGDFNALLPSHEKNSLILSLKLSIKELRN